MSCAAGERETNRRGRRRSSSPLQTVVAAVRDPEHATAQALGSLARGAGSRLVTVRYDAGDEAAAGAAVAELAARHEIDRLDVVVANAGVATHWPAVKDVARAAALEHVAVNALGALALYQATRGLLQNSSARPVFAAVGSAASALGYVIFPSFSCRRAWRDRKRGR